MRDRLFTWLPLMMAFGGDYFCIFVLSLSTWCLGWDLGLYLVGS